MAPKNSRTTSRNPTLVAVIGKVSRSKMYHKRGIWALKTKHDVKFPCHAPKPPATAPAAKASKFYPTVANRHKPKPTKSSATTMGELDDVRTVKSPFAVLLTPLMAIPISAERRSRNRAAANGGIRAGEAKIEVVSVGAVGDEGVVEEKVEVSDDDGEVVGEKSVVGNGGVEAVEIVEEEVEDGGGDSRVENVDAVDDKEVVEEKLGWGMMGEWGRRSQVVGGGGGCWVVEKRRR